MRAKPHTLASGLACLVTLAAAIAGADPPSLPKACIDGTGTGWRELGESDFTNANCDPDTWSWKDGVLHCTGKPLGILRSQKVLTNFELVIQWQHLKSGGNSGVFVWTTEQSVKDLKHDMLPEGIEVQVLDHGYIEQWEKENKKKAWFTTNGDVFSVGKSVTMKPFAPVAPYGHRSLPSKNLSKGINQWNHYYVRAINGEVRLWVNGEEVSGGTDIEPRKGYLGLESEGAPVEFRQIRLRELP